MIVHYRANAAHAAEVVREIEAAVALAADPALRAATGTTLRIDGGWSAARPADPYWLAARPGRWLRSGNAFAGGDLRGGEPG
ncbi:hypothetical protein [Amycolatopsis eburnea]|uniref:hypothetical protein n=1 Tax=Amycolatopsis eburnea TaxID=2267691 RepID=UPI001786243D|nr:hypothetical protein [Amycolatopsis eburnea]